MEIGIPKEVKTAEGRVALTPDACHELVTMGHEVLVQTRAGLASGYPDHDYIESGCKIVATAAELFQRAILIVKVKEPQKSEFALFTERHLLFCYLHLAAEPEVAKALQESGCTAIAFEGVTDARGGLPLLQPMSVIAGKLAMQYATTLLHQHHGGKGILIDGLAGVPRAEVTILGFGSAGGAAARYAAKLGAIVKVIDKDEKKLQQARDLGANVSSYFANRKNIDLCVNSSDVVIGAVLIPEKRAPVLVSRAQVANMQAGSVIVDIAVDQGGCIETTRPTNYENPYYVDEGVVHFAVTNIPGAVPRSASQALSGSILDSVKLLASSEWHNHQHIVDGLSIKEGRLLAA